VLTRDGVLTETLEVLGQDHDVFTVAAEADLASQLITGHAGVAIVDAAALASPVERLTERLKAQFPDLVLIVAGGVEDQQALAAQITSGTVYRFLHKPVSQQRVKLFVDAAWRRHDAGPGGAGDTTITRVALPQRSGLPPAVLIGGGALLGALGLLATWLMLRRPELPADHTAAADSVEASAANGARDEVLEDLLARADRAFAAGAYVAPPQENATDLYRQALRRSANDPRAGAGLERVIDKLLSAAEQQLLAQHIDEAQALTDQARTIKPDHVRVAFLTAQIGKERERATLTQAHEAAAKGHIEQAISVLDSATREGQHSPLVTETRRELEQKKSDERVTQYLAKANDRLRSGRLLDPAQDNAQFYIEAARALTPDDPLVRQAQRQLADRLVAEAHKALTAGNAEQADRWIHAASDEGANRDEIDGMKRESQRVHTTAKADAMARIALLFNQRLTEGRVIDPPSDSAKFYLAQLLQADATHPSAQLARQSFAARALEEARGALGRKDYAGARSWLGEARDAGAAQADAAVVERDISSAQTNTTPAGDVVSASAMNQTRYVAPKFPVKARAGGVSGWVDVQFLVKRDGSVSSAVIVGAEPSGVFEQSTLEAVRKWRYRPVMRDGQAVDQLVRLRVRFALTQ
jgi:TonB family protein